jgi:hypothetical protein
MYYQENTVEKKNSNDVLDFYSLLFREGVGTARIIGPRLNEVELKIASMLLTREMVEVSDLPGTEEEIKNTLSKLRNTTL